MARPSRYPKELLDRGVRLALEGERPISHIAADLGIGAETLRKHVRRAQVDAGKREGLTSSRRQLGSSRGICASGHRRSGRAPHTAPISIRAFAGGVAEPTAAETPPNES